MRREREVFPKLNDESQYSKEVQFPKKRKFSYKEIAEMVLEVTEWDWEATFNKSRREEVTFRRGIIDLIATENGCTLTECGRSSNRDHTTVIHSLHAVEGRLDIDMYARKLLKEIMIYILETVKIKEEE